ncbi:MAG: DUF1015 domain-containing protein [Saprospiraceae bacterium]|nr:DUF1015 domain-containing protein [Saprospiraceae bacterium]
MEINPFSATLPNLKKISDPDAFFQSVKEQYSPQLRQDFFGAKEVQSLYIQQIERPAHTYMGIIATVPIQTYREGLIKGHEETLERKGQIQVKLLRERQAMVKPVLLTYNNVSAIETWMQEQITAADPIQTVFFEEDQAYYRLWEVQSASKIREIQALFRQEVQRAYIADGHHRMLSTTDASLQLNAVLCSFFSEDQVLIRDFNRQVFVAADFDVQVFLQQLQTVAEVEALPIGQKPVSKHTLSLFLAGQWYAVQWKTELLASRRGALPLLDADILNEVVLQALLNVEDLRKTNRIKYIDGQSGIPELEQILQAHANSLLFCLYPINWSEMVQWADQDQTLPPKSTWFEPRMKNGLVVQDL